MIHKLTCALVGPPLALLATAAQAGVIYTNQALFDAAVAGAPLSWSENFEGLSLGALPSGPLSIGSSQAEIFTDGPQEVYLQTSTGNQAYWNVEPLSCRPHCAAVDLGPQTIIRGPGSSSLAVGALSFNYNMGGVGDNTWVASFISSAGITNTFLTETSVSYPNGENGQDVPLFLGWVGATNELLQQVIIAPPNTGILVDNISGFDSVPAPATLPLFATGLLGLWFARRKRGAAGDLSRFLGIFGRRRVGRFFASERVEQALLLRGHVENDSLPAIALHQRSCRLRRVADICLPTFVDNFSHDGLQCAVAFSSQT